LDSAALKGPAEADFAVSGQSLPVVREYRGIHLPRADEPAIETHLVGAVGGWAIRKEQFCKRGSRSSHCVPVLL
jgi:hypothetical protein